MCAVVIEQNMTLAQVLEDVRTGESTMIWYGATSCWWTHRAGDLAEACDAARGRASLGHSLPTDPRGGVLFEADNPEAFLRYPMQHPEHYGKHRLRAFLAAHHQNCKLVSGEGVSVPWCAATWEDYNALLDSQDAQAESPT